MSFQAAESSTLSYVPAIELFEATPNPYLLLAPDSPTYTIVGVNDAYLRATMTERQAIMGRSIFDVFPDDPGAPDAFSVRDLRASFDRAIQSGQPDRLAVHQHNIRRPDGAFEERYWRPLQVPVLGPGGEIVSLIHYAEDVTRGVLDARNARIALTASEARYRAIVDSSIDYAMIAMDLAGTITTWNTGAEHILGWSAEEMIGQPLDRFFTPEDRTDRIPESEMHSAMTKGRGLDERWHLKKGDVRFWASGEMMPLKDVDGTVIGYLKILRDRTAQRETELALERQTALLQTVTDYVSEAVFRLDPDGTILFANPAAEQLFGWDATDILGRNFHDTLHHHHDDGRPFPPEACVFVRALRDGRQLLAEEAVFFRKNGSPVPIACTSVPFRMEECVTGAVITVTDLTQQKQAQEQQQIVNQELSHRMKNMLAMILSIATQTLRSVPDREPVEAFEKRIHALSAAHDVLLQQEWTAAPLDAVASAVLQTFAQTTRLKFSGPQVSLGPRATLSVSLLLHELATNATKYGALSNDEGHVGVSWRVDGDGDEGDLVLDWEESGGPPVKEPARRGFGSRLIRLGLVGTGDVDLRYQPTGFRAEMRAPLAQIHQS